MKSNMMYYYIELLLFVLISSISSLIAALFFHKNSPTSPPGPKPWPIIGNIHLLTGNLPHRTLAELSRKYGPIMLLNLGRATTIVISSPNIAKEMFTKHDLAFSSRIVSCSARVANHDKHSMIWLPVCPKWRDLKKTVTIQLLTSQQLSASRFIRQKKVNELVEYTRLCCENGLAIDIGKAGFTTVLNLLSNTFFSIDLASYDSSPTTLEFKELVWNFLEETMRPNVSDLLPLVKYLDLQGIMKRLNVYFNKMFGVFENIIDERLKGEMESKDAVLRTLLKLVENGKYSPSEIKHMLVDIFVAGTETTSTTLEWAMTELLRNPKKMAKARNELDQVIDKNESIEESHISKLPYIQAIVKETLRLHPPAPFLIPHKALQDVQLCGYHIPKDAHVWVNLWSIGRDSNVWQDPSSFEPERFMGSEVDIDFKGKDFELIPFGAGRRICPGIPLAHRMLHLMLATLVHNFDWKYFDNDGVNEDNIDVDEKFALTLQRARPLLAIPILR